LRDNLFLFGVGISDITDQSIAYPACLIAFDRGLPVAWGFAVIYIGGEIIANKANSRNLPKWQSNAGAMQCWI
jgi:hypothetical protein